MTYAVVLAGGWGERLWPMSTRNRPKQLLRLAGDRPLVTQALDRVAPLVEVERTLVLTGVGVRESVRKELPAVPPSRVIGEPIGRNTAPAIALAARLLVAEDPEAVMVVLPADHVIGDGEAFRGAIATATAAAVTERALVTLGIRPARAETEYGYIKAGERTATAGVLMVERFTEKPDIETAESFLADGGYFWNSGMFIWRADRYLDEVERHLPELAGALAGLTKGVEEEGFADELERFYADAPSVSVDYGIMEKAGEVLVVPTEFDWDDVGAWSALGRVWPVDERGNAVRGEIVHLDSSGCVLSCEQGIVAVVGLTDTVVVRTGDATLVCPRERSRDVRRIVEELKARGVLTSD